MVICAAILIETNTEDEPIAICGRRHSDCYYTLWQLNPKLSKWAKENDTITEGFINNKNNFITRAQAYEEAFNCGQISLTTYEYKQSKGETTLYSEDLY